MAGSLRAVDPVLFDIKPASEDGASSVAVVTLNDPDHRNVLSARLVAALTEAMDTVESDPSIGALVVTGAGPAFCAGADLGSLAGESSRAATEAPSAEMGLRSIYEGFLRVARCPVPTLAAVNGPAVGAGMNLALACDVRVCARSARFDTRFLDLGLHPGGGHTYLLGRIVGPEVAAAMVLFGQRFDGPTAVERGLAFSCVEDGDLLDEAVALASRAASAPRELAIRVKDTMRVVAALDDHETAVDTELEAQIWSLGEPFFAERLAALRARVSGGRR